MAHPLTNEMCDAISTFDLHLWGDAGHGIRRDIRAGADWQLERVIEWLKDGGHTTDLLLDLKAAMRPQEDNQ